MGHTAKVKQFLIAKKLLQDLATYLWQYKDIGKADEQRLQIL